MFAVFGYVRPQKSELLVREYEQYKGVYCALCRALGKNYGAAARFALSYDCTFYALLLLSLGRACPGFYSGRCVVNPFKKCVYCTPGDRELDCASALSVILAYHKIRDDIADSRPAGKLRGVLFLPLAARARRKAARRFPRIDAAVFSAMRLQSDTERDDFSGIDRCAEPTASMLGALFALAAGDGEEKTPAARVLQQVGYYLGRWVYLTDAADDLEKDLQNGSFNPFCIQFGLQASDSPEELRKTRERINEILNFTLARLNAAFSVLDPRNFGTLLENIIEKGLPEMQKEILFQRRK